ncbi:MAG: Plasmid stabilization system [Candidatus Gottesmanbacteria bacterium GW2011_GWA2_41_12]|uniref:Plasmid stabilization system n=2 Tax=Candidatus Gottesmaniibacteriota TaxID=1752720 RepID=A0A0G0UI93_9BACT|nr:MAG: Plasmid stabilization system [Candidatus Gottesmanbacteria bacterium GW2011_GWC2_39_8]KKR88543.1 MAG: Plasmid stabilization system [Candidatus Gottesmanbacteria bacterium GW2011_GWA2_41_12]
MKIYITSKAQRELDKISDSIAKNIVTNILKLSDHPFPDNSKKLSGQENYRLRIGSFRVIYFIDKKKKEITVLRVADRKTIYR